ncbi:hypothetical protein GNI_034070 [Gregarina niphandrodes]|uniref:Uncharacterized protein n=1 Tax=Gregarina niphandrodes TaxID=110365 RepID=A0A023BB05_GRENI|nr:hypothetical protein GNI_034070 [Gregarina niphandrodes]EZG78621.1 hypothetical protein GNI_034070 [Gregarina niphandrodes]|eukprot:XP_011129234.1 hypothetical protein GNI_034070 [Gregarina niphandrodes]
MVFKLSGNRKGTEPASKKNGSAWRFPFGRRSEADEVMKPLVRVHRRLKAVDSSAADFYRSRYWLGMITAATRSAQSDELLAHLKEAEGRVLELSRPVTGAPISQNSLILRAATARYLYGSKADSGGKGGARRSESGGGGTGRRPVAKDARVGALEFAMAQLLTDKEHERNRCLRSINLWALKVLLSMQWPLTGFFIAVHSIERTIRSESPKLDVAQISRTGHLLGTACLLMAVGCECSHKELMRAKIFIGQVPSILSMNDLVAKQLTVVASEQARPPPPPPTRRCTTTLWFTRPRPVDQRKHCCPIRLEQRVHGAEDSAGLVDLLHIADGVEEAGIGRGVAERRLVLFSVDLERILDDNSEHGVNRLRSSECVADATDANVDVFALGNGPTLFALVVFELSSPEGRRRHLRRRRDGLPPLRQLLTRPCCGRRQQSCAHAQYGAGR